MMSWSAFSKSVTFDIISFLEFRMFFAKLAVTRCFIVLFYLLTLPVCYPIYYWVEVFERGEFHELL